MTLIERFIEFNSWTTSRKTALLMAIALIFHIAASPIVRVAASAAGIVRMRLLDVALISAVLVVMVCLAAALAATKAGKEGRWTAYLVVVLYGGWVGAFVTAMGVWSTPLLAWVPIIVILVALWYDEVIGWAAFAYSLLLGVLVVSLTLADLLPYAPAMLDRTLDAQRSGSWAAAIFAVIMGFYLYGFLLSILVVAARRLQDTRLHQAYKIIRRYVPSQIADAITLGRVDTADKHERRKLTLFFSDLVGFTDISEELEPEDLSKLLNEYFSEMTRIAEKHGGTVDELAGDAILIFFGAPNATDDQDHALRAVRMAVEMQSAVKLLNEKSRQAGIAESLRVRMGINTGVVTIGNFGSPDRMKYTALGKHVNIAARLQSHCEPGRVLVSQLTWLLVKEQIPCEPKCELTLKGIIKPVMAYEVAGAT